MNLSEKFVRISVDEDVATLVLDRPPLNVMNIAMMEEINEALLGLRGTEKVKVLVIRGSHGVFSTGIDVGEHTR
ncbi:MAG: enoyl-CoA hydratase/isomerase family protein, partial [Gemmatimonadales bacterium]